METTDYGHGITVESDSMSGIVRVNGKAVKKFRGETAWSDAERHAKDLMLKAMYASATQRKPPLIRGFSYLLAIVR